MSPKRPWYQRAYDWLERRIQFEGPVKDAVLHPVPRSTASWWYVFGSASLTLLILQVVTGVLLGLVYQPTAAHAWGSLQTLNHDLPLGWFLRAMHGWGSNFMVAVVLIHMAQVFLFGAYKYPRELTWIVGVFMLLMTLGMAFTGQVLRWDQDAYWGLGIGASIMGRVPWIGGELVHLLLGGPIINGATRCTFSWRNKGAAARRCHRHFAPSDVRIASPSAGCSARRMIMPFSKLSTSSTRTCLIRSGPLTNA